MKPRDIGIMLLVAAGAAGGYALFLKRQAGEDKAAADATDAELDELTSGSRDLGSSSNVGSLTGTTTSTGTSSGSGTGTGTTTTETEEEDDMPKPSSTITSALASGKSAKKPVMVFFGRPTCSDCRGMKNMLNKAGSEPNKLLGSFIFVDSNIDSSADYRNYTSSAEFTLPFIVFLDSFTGRKMTSSNGPLSPGNFATRMKSVLKTFAAAHP